MIPAWNRLASWLTRSGRLEVAILAAAFVAVVGLWIFGVLGAEVVEGDTGKFDERLLLACREPGNLAVPIGPHWTLELARDLSAFGGVVGLALLTAVIAGHLWLDGRYGLLTFILAAVGSGTVLSLVLKVLFHRPRPEIVPHLSDIATASFPSGHAMLSSVVFLTLAAALARAAPKAQLKCYYLGVAILLTGLIGCSRVYLGVHYPTDVLAGWSLGSAWAVICCLVAHYVARRAPGEAEGEKVA
jgi:undecaprenyl-diphosphatase